MAEDFHGCHAVDDVQIKQAVLVDVAKLGGPAPAAVGDAPGLGLVRPGIAVPFLEDVGHHLRGVVGAGGRHSLHYRQPLAHDFGFFGVWVHVGGEELRPAVVVDVAAVEAHCAKGCSGERVG